MKLGPSGASYALSEKTSVSFEISKLIAKSKKAHTIAESLIKPSTKKIQDIPLFQRHVKLCIQNMSNDIEKQVIDKIKCSPYFALQCDESTDVSQCCQLLVFIRFFNDNQTFQEELLFSQELETTFQGADVMNVINQYF
ncbi:hypothetical protein RN001_005736 [Aquatica leii]|uniref:Uncharacterized protein n=1 Tax=Aquatica leii TaxID=1421715 RepID=A0AAN7PC93_9COLE|nr:hypothetical protein RN001_005736 [Aquatica leii]